MVLNGLARLQTQFLEGWPSLKEPDIEGVLERFYEVASRRGVARTLAWLILSGWGVETMRSGILSPRPGECTRAESEGRTTRVVDLLNSKSRCSRPPF
jgi:hypothetical protein